MKKVFISYGSEDYRLTLEKIGEEARNLGIFDSIILYTEKDLPDFIKFSPLMSYEKGGGYWIWKPYIIWQTLQKCNEDDIVVYADSGCCLHKSEEWQNYFKKLDLFTSIIFCYRDDVDYGWESLYGCKSPKIKHWTKKSALSYFDILFGSNKWREFNKIIAGFIICKGKNNPLIREWNNITLFYPNLIIDPIGNEIEDQEGYFILHRHDQSILTPLAYYYSQKDEVLIIPEKCESKYEDSVLTTERRYILQPPKASFRSRMTTFVKSIIGKRIIYFFMNIPNSNEKTYDNNYKFK